MNSFDPFSRAAPRKEEAYATVKSSLQNAEIDSRKKVMIVLSNSRSRFLRYCLFLVTLAGVAVAIWPDHPGIIVFIAGLVLFWLLMTWIQGERMLRRFMREELP